MAATPSTSTIPPMTLEEEDQMILSRITNDERPLRRVIKKFQTYISLVTSPVTGVSADQNTPSAATLEDAREAFLMELASFQLLLKKNAMICEAEARQVEEYHREKARIDDEHGALRGQIEQLKTGLEHAQIQRKRKIEYDNVAEKINTFPSRDELNQSIQSLENDMATIQAEHETQDRTIYSQKSSLDGIITALGSLRFIGREDATVSLVTTPVRSPSPDTQTADGDVDLSLAGNSAGSIPPDTEMDTGNPHNGAEKEEGEREEGEQEEKEEGENTPVDSETRGTSTNRTDAGEDIEMGEVEEGPSDKYKKKPREDLEEGEASDESSVLSDPPDSDDI
ncbi:hypothetical protein HGRIS_009448 [Hohenbuehelia grisea]|uniref:Uncharacterized protein n=1 Tax=Hohenbuehelia grisea TaxID=104357 RepID=A0ABR3J1A0_9AGAR